MSTNPSSRQSANTNFLQTAFIGVVVVSYVLQVVLGLNELRTGTISRFTIEYLVISILPIAFFAVSHVLQSLPLSRIARMYRSAAAAAAAWCLWNALGLTVNRFLVREP